MSTTEHLTAIVERVREATKSLSGDEFRLREIAFEKLLEHELSNGGSSNGAATLTTAEARGDTDSPDASYSTPEMRADAVARYFKIDSEEARDIFDLTGEAPILDLPSRKISASKAAAVRQIALLICGARTALGLETGTAHIREAADHYDQADPNFMTYLTNFDKIAVRGKKSSPNRLVRMRVIGAEEAQAVARELVSNGG